MKKDNSRRRFFKKSIGVAVTIGFSDNLAFETLGMEGGKRGSYFYYNFDRYEKSSCVDPEYLQLVEKQLVDTIWEANINLLEPAFYRSLNNT